MIRNIKFLTSEYTGILVILKIFTVKNHIRKTIKADKKYQKIRCVKLNKVNEASRIREKMKILNIFSTRNEKKENNKE